MLILVADVHTLWIRRFIVDVYDKPYLIHLLAHLWSLECDFNLTTSNKHKRAFKEGDFVSSWNFTCHFDHIPRFSQHWVIDVRQGLRHVEGIEMRTIIYWSDRMIRSADVLRPTLVERISIESL